MGKIDRIKRSFLVQLTETRISLMSVFLIRPSKSKEKADERSLDILRDSAKPAASQKLPWEQESTPKPASAPAAPRQAMISSIFGDDSVSSQPRAAQPEPERQPALPRVSAPQPVFPSMFPMMSETNGQFNNSAWQLEQVVFAVHSPSCTESSYIAADGFRSI